MLELNKPILADDPYRLLKYECGVFEVVSPSGERLRVIGPVERPPNGGLQGENEQESSGWWRIERIA